MKTNKFLLGLGLAFLGCFTANAQSGLQNIIVEKYYQSNAADAANATANGGTLNVGSVTYRVFVDLAPGWKLNNFYGDANHALRFTTTTNFFNDPNNGVVIGAAGTSTNNARSNTRLIDSYLTIGSAAANRLGILKTEDTDGSPGNTQNILQNNPGGVYGAPINIGNSANATAKDGMMPGSVAAPNVLGITTESDIFDQTPGSIFTSTNAVVAVLGGVVGTTTSNVVFIGQFTTDGVLGFELNCQVQNTLTNVSELWVASNPQFGEFTMSALTLAPPTVTVTSPANGANIITGTTLTLAATATDNGTVTSVQFNVDGVPVGTDLTAPFTATYAATIGSHTITAIATDNDALTATSSNVVISVANNQAPTVTVSGPASAKLGDVVTFTASAADVDGTVTAVSFSVAGSAIGTKTIAPYTFTWTANTLGPNSAVASATDNNGAVGLSAPFSINIVNNLPPTVSVVSPTSSTNYINATASLVVISVSVSAADADGTVTAVELLANGTPVATVTSAPYTFTYSPSTFGPLSLAGRATDNNGTITLSSAVVVNIVNANQLPYETGAVSQKCNQGSFCVPIIAATTYTVDNVIGYDIVLTYDAAKVTPTGSVTVSSNLITPSLVTVANAFANGTMNISASFIGTAPANTEFTGNGEIFCVGFVKNVMTEVDTAVISVTKVDESYFTGVTTQTATAGRYTTYRDTMFNGRLKFASNNTPVKYDAVNTLDYLVTNVYGSSTLCVTNTVAAGVNPNLNGDFVYNILNGNSINISRDITGNGGPSGQSVQFAIQGNDALFGRYIVLNNTVALTPTYWQVVAADVNLDGIVSSGDITQINQRSVGILTEFKQAWNYNTAGVKTGADSKDYLFVDSTRTVADPAFQISTTYPLNNLIGYSKAKVPVVPFCLPVPQTSLGTCPTFSAEVYKGIMLGDIDGNVSVLSGTLLNRPSSSSKVIIDLQHAIVSENSIEVPVTFESTEDVKAYDFALGFDESHLTYNTLINFPSNTDALAHYNVVDKTLRMTATNVDLKSFAKKSPVAFVKFSTTLENITAASFTGVAGFINGVQVPIVVSQRNVGINSIDQDGNVSIFPNPTEGIINITAASNAVVEIMDVTGRNVLLTTTVSSSKTEKIDMSSFSNGVYVVKISNADFSIVKKVIINK